MSLVKKLVFYLFLLLAVGLGVWAYFGLKNNKKPKVEALSLLPDSCLVYLTTANFPELNKKLNSQSLIVDRLKLFGDIEKFCNSLRAFDSLFSSSPFLLDEIRNKPVHFAIYDQALDWLATFNIGQLGDQKRVRKTISEVLSAKEVSPGIYSFRLQFNTFYFSIRDGVVMIGNTEKIIAHTGDKTAPKLLDNPAFKEFMNSGQDNNLLSIYVDHKKYVENELASKLNLSAICESGFSSGTIDLQPSEVKVNGILKPGTRDFISALSDEPAQATEFIAMLPLTVSYFRAYGFNNFKHLHNKASDLLEVTNSTFWKTVNDSALYNLRDEFFDNATTSLVEFETTTGQKFVSIQLNDTLKALSHLKFMSDSVLKFPSDSVFRLMTFNAEQGIDLFYPLSINAFHYAAIYKSCLFFSKTAEDLLQLKAYLKNEMLLVKDKSFAAYRKQNIPETFNLLIYSSPNQNRESISTFFNFENRSKKDPFVNFRHFSFSLRNDGGKFKFRWHLINETESDTKEQNSLWTLKLDTVALMKAANFINHNTHENELLIQDEARNLYLVNAKGTILWKKKINEKITSQLFTVDAFKNNKFQVLFSTGNYLHLLDRNGNYIEGYPVKLPEKSSTPLNVIDYDNTRDYRLFICCKNNQVYNYSINGKKQTGFASFKTDQEVVLPVRYVKVGLSDYLVALDVEGKIYTFSRKGEGRIGLKNKAIANCSAFYVDASGNINSTYFIYADDKNGLISKISFSDKKEIAKLNYNIENASVGFGLIDDNKIPDVFFTRQNTLMAYDLNGNLLVKKSIGNDLSETEVYKNESRLVFLSYSKFRKELVILDQVRQTNKMMSASALPLVTDLFNDNKRYLLVTNVNQLECMVLE